MTLTNNIGSDAIGLKRFAKVIERLCKYSDVSVLLYQSDEGLFLNEIATSLNVSMDTVLDILDILVKDEMVEEDRIRQFYSLSDIGNDVFNIYNNDATITLDSRLKTIHEKLQLYSIAVENHNEESRKKIGDDITNYLYRTYSNTQRELKNLRTKVENEYKVQRNLRFKSQMLSIYIRKLEEIMYSLDVKRPSTRDEDGNQLIFINLKQMLFEDKGYGKDYRPSIEGFFKNCDAKLSNQILELYDLFRAWWGKTKVALEDFRVASKALDALINYNMTDIVVRESVENNSCPLPPIYRRFGKVEGTDDECAGVDLATRILSLDSVNADEYDLITSCCAQLHYDFVNFSALEDQAVPESMIEEGIPVMELPVIDKEREIEAFMDYNGTMLSFLRERYPDLPKEAMLRFYLEIILETGDRPMVFDSSFDAEFRSEQFDDSYNVVSVMNHPKTSTP